MKTLDSKLLSQFLKKASTMLEGKWLLIGGTLLPAVGIDIRATVDIDLIGLGIAEKAQTLKLMELAESLGLSIESVNQAADFFLSRTKYVKSDLILLRSGRRCKIFRPSASLYIRLKLGRFTESDYEDCLHYFKFCESIGDRIKIDEIEKAVRKVLADRPSEEKQRNLDSLLNLVSNSKPTSMREVRR